MLRTVQPALKRLGYSLVLGTVLAAQPLTVVVSSHAASAGSLPAYEAQAVPLNSANATDLPDEIEDMPVITPKGVLIGHVSDIRAATDADSFRVAAVEITADDVNTSTPLSWWVDAQRVSVTPDAVILAPAGEQQAQQP